MDIEKIYRQITVHLDDCRYQILWSVIREPVEFQFNTHTATYDLCTPYLALCVLQQLADEESRYLEASSIVLNKMYVDDVLSGADTISHARIKAMQLDQLMRRVHSA